MVFIFPPDTIQNYAKRVQRIIDNTDLTNSTRTSITSKQVELPQGVLTQLSFQYKGSSNAKKGDLYVYLGLNAADGGTKAILISDYISNISDPRWLGELPIEDGDFLQYLLFNSNANLTSVQLRGQLIRV